VSGMHYTGMAALRVQAAPGAGMSAMGRGATGLAFLLPLIVGITGVTFILTAMITLTPTEAEIREDAALMERIAKESEKASRPIASAPTTWPGRTGSHNGAAGSRPPSFSWSAPRSARRNRSR
jgi:hypothetical protein